MVLLILLCEFGVWGLLGNSGDFGCFPLKIQVNFVQGRYLCLGRIQIPHPYGEGCSGAVIWETFQNNRRQERRGRKDFVVERALRSKGEGFRG